MLILVLLLILIISAFIAVSKTQSKEKYFVLIFFLVVVFLIEALSYAFLLNSIKGGRTFFLIGNQKVLDSVIKNYVIKTCVINRNKPDTSYKIDDDIGYSPTENSVAKVTNSKGLRAVREYSLIPNPDVLRFAAFGDSFVFGDGETTQDVWPYLLENSVNNLEVMNFGVSGYGLGQSYLRYINDGIQYSPDVIFFNYVAVTERDKYRAKEILQGSKNLMDSALFRSRFWVENGILMSRAMTPLDLFDQEFREKYIYESAGITLKGTIWNSKIFSISNVGLIIKNIVLKKKALAITQDEDLDVLVSIKLLDNILQLARRHNSTVIFFYRQKFENLPFIIQKILNDNKDVAVYVDAGTALWTKFAQYGVKHEELLNRTDHYNPQGNKIYAEVIASVLRSRSWGNGDRVFQYEPQSHAFKRVRK